MELSLGLPLGVELVVREEVPLEDIPFVAEAQIPKSWLHFAPLSS